MYRKATIRKAGSPEIKKLMETANEMEKSLKAIKKMVEDQEQQRQWEYELMAWHYAGQGPVLDSNPLFDDEDREKWAEMKKDMIRKGQNPNPKIRQSGPTNPRDWAMLEAMRKDPYWLQRLLA